MTGGFVHCEVSQPNELGCLSPNMFWTPYSSSLWWLLTRLMRKWFVCFCQEVLHSWCQTWTLCSEEWAFGLSTLYGRYICRIYYIIFCLYHFQKKISEKNVRLLCVTQCNAAIWITLLPSPPLSFSFLLGKHFPCSLLVVVMEEGLTERASCCCQPWWRFHAAEMWGKSD